jgi:hypothetical protein
MVIIKKITLGTKIMDTRQIIHPNTGCKNMRRNKNNYLKTREKEKKNSS